MKEQVKEWIVDKNLTTDSFDSIMIGVIYNSGHSTLDDPDVRKWIETHPDEFRGMLLPNLTDDQQVVLEWLKEVYTDNDEGYFSVISYLTNPTTEEEVHDPAHIALACLHPDEENQVLAAFAEWGNKEGEG